MAGLPWFKVYAAETLSDERFQGWDVDERGAWFTLVCVAWREGSIPGDQGSLARLLHVDGSRMRLLWSAIGDRFTPHPDYPGRLTSPRLEIEREDAERLSERKSAAGRKGATSRWETAKRENSRRMRVPLPSYAAVVANDNDKGRADTGQDKAGQELPLAPSPSDSTPEPVQDDSPVAMTLPCVGNGPKEYPVRLGQIAKWQEAYPGVDVLAEVRKSLAWLEANPAKRKTHRGCPAFLVGWLNRAQDRGGGRPAPPIEKSAPAPTLNPTWLASLPAEKRQRAQDRWSEAIDRLRRAAYPDAFPRLAAAEAEAFMAGFEFTEEIQ